MAIQLQADFAVARVADGDYSTTVFQCPTHPDCRSYESVRPVRVVGRNAVAAACYWCDTHRRIRGQDRGFDYDNPQWHTYEVI
jgi:hypothetical protein